jgi:hypothetical protein
MIMRIAILLLSITAAACGGRGDAVKSPPSGGSGDVVKSPPSETPMWDRVFPAYPGATEVCWEHILGSDGTGARIEIMARSYASADDDEKVASFIATKLGRGSASHEIAIDDHRLHVYRIDDPDAHYPHCETKPPAGTKTIIVVSGMTRG